MADNYALRRIQEAKWAQFEGMREMLKKLHPPGRMHRTVYTDFNALIKHAESEKEKSKNFV